jgi:crotonobetainyl-CoA:carnitine CoA-transferase CaiB-like acyl-CoA transferase
MAGPLSGIKILEFSEIIAVPHAGLLLSDMGAEVIKVEPLWGDAYRAVSSFAPNESKSFIAFNRGKRSLPLDLTKEKARQLVYDLIPLMDVVMVNYRPDVPYKLGIDYETLSKINPALIYCENTAFGRQGPQSHRPGYDLIAQAVSGLLAAEGKFERGTYERIFSSPFSDFATGVVMAWGISAALYSREKTGKGQKLEATLLGTSLMFQSHRFLSVEGDPRTDSTSFLQELKTMRRQGASLQELYARYRSFLGAERGIYYRTFLTKDSVVAVACLSSQLRERLMSALGLDDVHDIRFDANYDPDSEDSKAFEEELSRRAEAVFAQYSTDEWIETLDKSGVPCSPVLFAEELWDDEQVLANDLIVETQHSTAGRVKGVGPFLKMSETPLTASYPSPSLGEHTDEILGGMGLTPDQISQLRDEGVTL